MAEKAFKVGAEYQKTGMRGFDGSVMEVESAWTPEAREKGLLRIKLGDKTIVVRAVDMISNLMAHSGEESARYMSDGLMAKSKRKRIIQYPFTVRVQRMHMPGEMLRAELQIVVPEELMDAKHVERKHIVHEGRSGGAAIIRAPRNAGHLPSGAPKLS